MEANHRESWKASWKVWTFILQSVENKHIFEWGWQGAKQFTWKMYFIADYRIYVKNQEKTLKEQGPCLSSSLLYPQQ